MNFRNLEFLLSEAFVGIRRNMLMAMASVTTIALALALLGGATLAIIGVERFANNQPAKFEIAVFLNTNVSRQEANETRERIALLESVREAILVPKEDAWPELQKSLAETVDTSGVGQNPLPDAIRVKLKDPKKNPEVTALIYKMPAVKKVNNCQEQLNKVLAFVDVVKFLGTAVAIGLTLATALIISNTIKLTVHARRREISIMALVGATSWFIRLPLIFEGIILGIVGGALGVGFVAGASSYLSYVTLKMMPLLSQLSSGVQFTQMLIGMTAAGAIIGAMGSFISIRRFLRV